ncbi:MAG: pilus assembly FimT family protein [Oceanobacter sp.]
MGVRVDGFTMVEMILVITLLGILSAFATSRFASQSDYSAREIEQHWLSVLRQARQLGLSRADQSNVTLTIRKQGGVWISEITAPEGETLSSQLDASGLTVHLGSGNNNGACSSLPSTPFSLSLDGNGQLSPFSNQRLCVTSDPVINLCISASGHVFSGFCP